MAYLGSSAQTWAFNLLLLGHYLLGLLQWLWRQLFLNDCHALNHAIGDLPIGIVLDMQFIDHFGDDIRHLSRVTVFIHRLSFCGLTALLCNLLRLYEIAVFIHCLCFGR